jgi:hypothetical protein
MGVVVMASTKDRSMGARIALAARMANSTTNMAAKVIVDMTRGGTFVLEFSWLICLSFLLNYRI